MGEHRAPDLRHRRDHHPPPRGRYCVLLGSGTRGQAPSATDQGDGLEAEILDRFDLPVYVPPISPSREIDVLAFLDYWNKARSSFVGIRYRMVGLSFLQRLVFGGPHPNNLEGIYRRLRMLNHLNRPEPADETDLVQAVKVETLKERAATANPDGLASDVREGVIPFEALPDLAVRLYLWFCQREPAADVEPGTEGARKSGRQPPESLLPFTSGLTADAFLGLSAEQFVRDHVLPGLASDLAGRADRLPLLLHRVRHQPVFGTTLEALQEGLRIDPGDVEARLGRPANQERTLWSAAESPTSPADGPAGVASPGGLVNRFCVEETTYHIVFRQPGGRVEQGRFLLGKNFGIDYYHHLVHNPEHAFSARELESQMGRKEREFGDTIPAGSVEAGFSTAPSFDPIHDDEAKRAFHRRIKEAQEDIETARRRGDESWERRAREELDAIMTELGDAVHRGRQKGLDPAAKQARERVRKAMDDARAKLTHAGLHDFASYLKDRVRFEGGKWTYLPPKSSAGWQS